MKQKSNKKYESRKAGFGTAHVILILMSAGLSLGCLGSIYETITDIFVYKSRYEDNLVELEDKKVEAEELNLLINKMNDPDYIKSYLRGVLMYSEKGEIIFVTQGE